MMTLTKVPNAAFGETQSCLCAVNITVNTGVEYVSKQINQLCSGFFTRNAAYSLTEKWTNCTYPSTTSTTGPQSSTTFRLDDTRALFCTSPTSTRRACSSSRIFRGVGEQPIHPNIFRVLYVATAGKLLILLRILA